MSKVNTNPQLGYEGTVDDLKRTLSTILREHAQAINDADGGIFVTGVAGDGVKDDIEAIQLAIDTAIYSAKPGGKVRLPAGVFRITRPIHLGYGERFTSICLQGEGVAYAGTSTFCGTTIFADFNNAPAVVVQGGRSSSIKDLTILGKNNTYISTNDLCGTGVPVINDLLEANWVDPTFPAASSSRYAPYSGIAIDPYSGVRPAVSYPDVIYPLASAPLPTYTSILTQYGKNFSSDTLIERVSIFGFVVGVANMPSDADGNADYTRLKDCTIENTQFAVSVGNTQSRLVNLDHCIIVRCHTAITTVKHGKQLGKTQFVVNQCEFGRCINWIDITNSSYGAGTVFIGCYGEVMYKIGKAATSGAQGLQPIKFINCEWQFDAWAGRSIPTNLWDYEGGGHTTFDGCSFGAVAGVNFIRFLGKAESYRFSGCYFGAGYDATKLYVKTPVSATGGFIVGNCETNLGDFSARIPSYNIVTNSAASARDVNKICKDGDRSKGIPVYASVATNANTETTDGGFNVMAGRNTIPKASCTSISIAGKEVTVNLTGAVGSELVLRQNGGVPGDVMIDTETGMTFVVKSIAWPSIVLVAQTGYNYVTNALVTNPTLTGFFYALNCRRYTFGYVTEGTTTAASAVITACQRPDAFAGYLNDTSIGTAVDDYLFIGNGNDRLPNSSTGSVVTAIDTAAKTITFNTAFTYTKTQVRQDLYVRKQPLNDT